MALRQGDDQDIELQPLNPIVPPPPQQLLDPDRPTRLESGCVCLGIIFFLTLIIVVMMSVGCGKKYKTVHDSSEFCQNVKLASTIMKLSTVVLVVGGFSIAILGFLVMVIYQCIKQKCRQQ